MSRDYNDIIKKIDQSHKNLYENDTIEYIIKDQYKILKEIGEIKKEVKDITSKIDIMLEILNSFTIMLEEDVEEDGYISPDQAEEWNTYDDDDDYEENEMEY